MGFIDVSDSVERAEQTARFEAFTLTGPHIPSSRQLGGAGGEETLLPTDGPAASTDLPDFPKFDERLRADLVAGLRR